MLSARELSGQEDAHPQPTYRRRGVARRGSGGRCDSPDSGGAGTVIQHVKDARDRYGVTKRTLLAIRALFDGQISFADVFGR
jgi:LuxR family quorum-sensing system transcriptional regulator CciR